MHVFFFPNTALPITLELNSVQPDFTVAFKMQKQDMQM